LLCEQASNRIGRPPPAAYGTTRVIGRAGHSPARADPQVMSAAAVNARGIQWRVIRGLLTFQSRPPYHRSLGLGAALETIEAVMSYRRAYGLTRIIQGYAVSDVRRPVSLRRRFQAFDAAATIAL
jgi:hypothetical protein